MTEQKVTIRVPSVAHKAAHETDAQRYRIAADKLRRNLDVGGSSQRDAVAELLERIANQLSPDVTEPAMTPGERAYFAAARDLQGNVRLSSGRGLLVATADHTIDEVRVWLENAGNRIPKRIERAEENPWQWVRQYRAVMELMEHEQQEAQA